MCGIFSLLNANTIAPDVIQNFQKGKLRGPEVSIIRIFLNSIIFGFHRLAINGLTKMSDQPLNISNCVLICNGEIYNHTYLFSLINVSNVSWFLYSYVKSFINHPVSSDISFVRE